MSLSRRQLFKAAAAAWTAAAPAGQSQTPQRLNPQLSGDLYPVHDPCIIKSGNSFYVFCTTPRGDAPAQLPWYGSRDLLRWEKGGHVFSELPAWAKEAVPGTRGCWAPDITFFKDQYWLYYACSTFGSNRSVIGLATSASLDPGDSGFGWQDRGLVLASQTSDDFNALDPARVIGHDGRHWLVFGSFWTGIKAIEIEPLTGKPLAGASRHDLARRPVSPDSIEGAFVIERAGYYYLFASFDFCCRGVNSSYYTVVGRSPEVLGPYLDRSGKPMLEGGGTVVLAATAADPRWVGPGHIGIARDGGNDYMAYHAYDTEHAGRPTLRLARLTWSTDGWPTAAI